MAADIEISGGKEHIFRRTTPAPTRLEAARRSRRIAGLRAGRSGARQELEGTVAGSDGYGPLVARDRHGGIPGVPETGGDGLCAAYASRAAQDRGIDSLESAREEMASVPQGISQRDRCHF